MTKGKKYFLELEPQVKKITISSIYCLFSLFLAINSEIIYPHQGLAFSLLNGLFYINLLLSIGVLWSTYQKREDVLNKLLIAGGFLLLCAYFFVIPSSPSPHIDVWVYAKKGADFLLNGVNPYGEYYPDLYNGKYELTHGYCYWPFPAYMYTLSRFLFDDVRWILVLGKILEAGGIWQLASQQSTSRRLLYIVSWLSFPVSYFVLEQSWTDGLIIPGIFWFAYYLKNDSWKKAAIILGVMCISKQYMIFLAVLSFFYIWNKYKVLASIKYFLITGVTSILIALPFLIWDFSLFWQKSVVDLLSLGFREDALSWIAYFYRFHHFYIKGEWTALLYGGGTIVLSLLLLRCKMSQLEKLFGYFVIIYCVVFLFGKQAFCNYYFMLASILWSYIILIEDSKKRN